MRTVIAPETALVLVVTSMVEHQPFRNRADRNGVGNDVRSFNHTGSNTELAIALVGSPAPGPALVSGADGDV
jgi:hypothetical protein